MTASGETPSLPRPRLDIGPRPRRTASDDPARRGQQPSGTPDVHGGALHAEALGDLGDADGVAAHERTVANLLTDDQSCSDTHYMTTTEATTLYFVTRAGSVISGGHEDRKMVAAYAARKNAASRRSGDRSNSYAVTEQALALR